MWQYTRELLAILFVAFLGYGLVATMLRGSIHLLSRVELASYSFTVGLGALTSSMFLLSLFEVPFSLPAILLFGLIPAALLLAGRKIRVAEISCTRPAPPEHIFVSSAILPQRVSILVLVATLLFVLVGCLNEPISEMDPVAAWALHAKVFYCDRTAFPLYLTSGGCGPFVSHWKPLLPLTQTWVHIGMGSYDDLKVKVVFFLMYAAMLGALFGALRRLLSRTYSLALLLLVATAPAIIVPFPGGSVASAYADVPLALFVTAATGLLVAWMASENKRFLILASLLVALAVWVKREGLVFAGVSTGLVWIFELSRKTRIRRERIGLPLSFTLAPAISIILLELNMSRFPDSGLLVGDVLGSSRVFSAAWAARLFKLLGYLALRCADPSNWGPLWLLLVLLVLLRAKHLRKRIIAFPLLVIVGYLAFALAFMAASAYGVGHLANLDMRRVLIQVAPVAAMVIGLLSAVQDPQAEAH
jgi:hypothetical protein